jgi:hypothetical protein
MFMFIWHFASWHHPILIWIVSNYQNVSSSMILSISRDHHYMLIFCRSIIIIYRCRVCRYEYITIEFFLGITIEN